MSTTLSTELFGRDLPPNIVSKINELMVRVDDYARKSRCPDLQVAYIATDPNGEEIAHGINGRWENERLHESIKVYDGLCDPHAEEMLTLAIKNLGTNFEELYGFSNYSPCRNCVPKLKAVNVDHIIFSNVYRDTLALGLAHRLGLKLSYFHAGELLLLPSSVITYLEHLNITSSANSSVEKREPNHQSITSKRERLAYVSTHKKQLQVMLNTLLIQLIEAHANPKRERFIHNRGVAIVLSQIETEQECLRWAQRGVILRKHP